MKKLTRVMIDRPNYMKQHGEIIEEACFGIGKNLLCYIIMLLYIDGVAIFLGDLMF